MFFYTSKPKILLGPGGGSQHDRRLSEGSTGAGGQIHRMPLTGRYFFIHFDWNSCLECFLICGKFLSGTALQLQPEAILATMHPQYLRSSLGKLKRY